MYIAVNDLYPDIAVALGRLCGSSLITRCFSFYSENVAQICARIVALAVACESISIASMECRCRALALSGIGLILRRFVRPPRRTHFVR